MKTKKVNIENIFYPERNKLIRNKNGCFNLQIVDAELDAINCEFNFDNCVKINTNDFTYLTLSRKNLEVLIDALDESETDQYGYDTRNYTK